MRILICGSRNWIDWGTLYRIISALPPGTVIISGEARGADRIARRIAEACGLEVEKYPANWNAYGKAAGPIRNRQMLKEGKPDLVLAFHEKIRESKGTGDMVRISVLAGIDVLINPTHPLGSEVTG